MALKMWQLVIIGILLIIIGFVIVFFGALMGAKEGTSKTKVAVGGFIGFIPFGFGNDKKMVMFAVVASLAMFLIFLFLQLQIHKS